MADLTDDERAVLMIAEQGEYMAPIGRWAKSIENLTMLGLMKKLDPVNFVITDNGRKILAARQHEEDEQFRQATANLMDTRNAQMQVGQSLQEAAKHLADAARARAKISGQPANLECWGVGQQVIARALELVNDRSR